MKHFIPDNWKEKVRLHILQNRGENRSHLLAHDFLCNQSVHLAFEDGSYAMFHYAFYMMDKEAQEVAIFTEHCGYHFLSSRGLKIQNLQTLWPQSEDGDD